MANEADLLRMLEPTVRPAGAPSVRRAATPPVERQDFAQLLREAKRGLGGGAEPVKLSAHAQQRLAQRGVELSGDQMQALAAATSRAEARGGRDTLVLMDRMGLIVNVPSRTVVTVMPEDRMQTGVVTQIDSAVIVS